VSHPAGAPGQEATAECPPNLPADNQQAPDPDDGPPEPAEAGDAGGSPVPAADIDPSTAYLLARLRVVETRVRVLVAHRRRDDPAPEDPFRGLYLSDEHVDRLLAGGGDAVALAGAGAGDLAVLEEAANRVEAIGTPIRLRRLADRAGLDALDVDLLLVALAPDLDSRFERLYGYLNDDVTRRRATIGLSLELCGASAWSAGARSRLSPDAPLTSAGLVSVEETERPFLSRSIRVPDRVAAHLLGDDRPDPAVTPVIHAPAMVRADQIAAALGDVLARGVELVYLRERPGASAATLAASALEVAGRPALIVDLDHLSPSDEIEAVARIVGREALLTSAGLVAGPVEALLNRGLGSVRAFAGLPGPVLLHGRAAWEPAWSRVVPLVVETAAGSASQRLDQWLTTLGEDGPAGIGQADVTTQFLLSGEQVSRTVEAARLQAQLAGEAVSVEHLRAGARAQNGAGLERLARRVQPAVGWEDLVLAPATADGLRELAVRARRRDVVLDDWGMRPGGGRGRGIMVLFAGDSGTGKTTSAEVLAGDLGLDLYAINLATVVDKYVGETEKNLERIFSEADGVNAVLLFDEADALFGKRSEVRDANDRYANIEVAYLLQRMESFDGLAILATNLRANVDEAFARRLDMVIDFPSPDVSLRQALWDRCLSPGVPRAADLDLDFCAQAFELSGGNIRSIAITAAYMAADEGRPIAMVDIIRGVHREYRKLGRMVVASEFGPYFHLTGV
jgi:ATPase family associated with various cellular activities (AAA)